jgi:DNA mismatch endonuclease (patch repair protein)
MDKFSKEKRAKVMSKIRSKNTKPEVILRKELHRQGFRYRLHVKKLPGKPDIVFNKHKVAIFVHGCFWHLHSNCREGRIPNTRREYWEPKLQGNVSRDKLHVSNLKKLGWTVLTIWECEIEKSLDSIITKISNYLTN